jgi:hypothetical protein
MKNGSSTNKVKIDFTVLFTGASWVPKLMASGVLGSLRKVMDYEANVSAQQCQKKTHPWFPGSHVHQGWKGRFESPSSQGAQAPLTIAYSARGLFPTKASG